ncbi:hypothetical protein FIM02_02390 [SAR202 cluster bacterium AD-802-E10_MRT_200m]|nr:hypothetical protein [SAR202 cluster bacterium AD-802-E10_MRT_200m]
MGEESFNEKERLGIVLCIFPHLTEFLILDFRDEIPGRPCSWVQLVEDLFPEAFYEKIEKGFSEILRNTQHPFLNMMELPNSIGALIQKEGLEAILTKVNGGFSEAEGSQIAILLCNNGLFEKHEEQFSDVVKRLAGSDIEEAILEHASREMARLAKLEEVEVGKIGREHRIQAVWGREEEFITLWENPS